MEDLRHRLIPLLMLSACSQAQSDEVSESSGDRADDSPAPGPVEMTPARSNDGGPGPTTAPVEMGQDGGASNPDTGAESSSETVGVASLPEWEAGVPAELAADTARCVLTSASFSNESCQLAIECDPEHNPGRLMSTCRHEPEGSQHLCACSWVGENNLSRIFFDDTPYPGDALEPCVASMEKCARIHTE